jgi:hypothetical protein
MMTEDQTLKIYDHWAACLKACLAEGIPPGDAVPALLHLSGGCLKGFVGPEAGRKEILKLRDDIYREMTRLANLRHRERSS